HDALASGKIVLRTAETGVRLLPRCCEHTGVRGVDRGTGSHLLCLLSLLRAARHAWRCLGYGADGAGESACSGLVCMELVFGEVCVCVCVCVVGGGGGECYDCYAQVAVSSTLNVAWYVWSCFGGRGSVCLC